MSEQIVFAIRPVEIDDKHYISLSVNRREIRRWGPLADANVAGDMANQLAQAWRARTGLPPAWVQAAPRVCNIAFDGAFSF